MAEIISSSGYGKDIYGALYKWLNWLPGSLASCTVAAAAVFAAVCGSSVATAATVGLVGIPQMLSKDTVRGLPAARRPWEADWGY
jgi:TRAP-type C4-dicarboxylate transport system permease large subunit